MADLPPSGSCTSFDPGSARFSLGVYNNATGPEDVLMGEERDMSGQMAVRYYYPSTLMLPEKTPDEIPDKIPDEGTGIELAGFDPNTDREIIHGIKQALDEDLCKPGSPGAEIRTRLARYGPVEAVIDDCYTMIFRYGKERMDMHRAKNNYDGPLERLCILIPAKHTRGSKAKATQERYRRWASLAGFPADIIDFKSETEASVWYGWLKQRQAAYDDNPEPSDPGTPEPPKKQIMINMGGAVMDITVAEFQAGTVQLLCPSVSHGGGILNVFSQLDKELRDKAQSFIYLQRHIFDMDEKCKSHKVDNDKTYQGKDLAKMLADCYDGGLSLAERLLWKFPNVTDVILTGVPPSTNKLIQFQAEERFNRLCREMREKGHAAELQLQIESYEFASTSVHRGGCIPCADNPASRFHEVNFGILIRGIKPEEEPETRRKRKRGKSPDPKDDMRVVIQLKEAYSDKLETYWEPVEINPRYPKQLTIEPHTITDTNWKPLEDYKSLETDRPVGSSEGAMPMEPITVRLKASAGPKRRFWVRFKREDPKLYPTLYILQVDGRRRKWDTPDPTAKYCIEVKLELCCDEQRCYFVRRGEQHDTDEEDEEEDDDLEELREAPPRQVPKTRRATSKRLGMRRSTRLRGSQTEADGRVEGASQQRRGVYDGPFSDDEAQMEANEQLLMGRGQACNSSSVRSLREDDGRSKRRPLPVRSNRQRAADHPQPPPQSDEAAGNGTREKSASLARQGSDPQAAGEGAEPNLHVTPTPTSSTYKLPSIRTHFREALRLPPKSH